MPVPDDPEFGSADPGSADPTIWGFVLAMILLSCVMVVAYGLFDIVKSWNDTDRYRECVKYHTVEDCGTP